MNASTLISYAISIAVPVFAVYIIFLLDMFGTGKALNIGGAVVWGIISFGLAYLLNTFTIQELGLSFQQVSTRTAPVLEELLKAGILLFFVGRPFFRYFVDGAVYGFAAGIGFAMTENIFYISNNADENTLSLAISRVLSASLMHATASAVVGIALGLSRRAHGRNKIGLPLLGMVFAIAVHLIYNNLLFALGSGIGLLLTAIGIGLGGGVLIAVFMNWGLTEEKKRFTESLGLGTGVSSAERKAVQKLGSEAIEDILEEMALIFGREKADLIRQLLVIQANIGILRNNLKSPVGERLRLAWLNEIDSYNREMDKIRKRLGAYTMTLLRSLLPEDDSAEWAAFSQQVANYDPAHVHAYDLFILASRLAGTVSPQEIEDISNQLKQISIFKNVELADLDNLSRAISTRTYRHGQMIFDKGASGDYMYLIKRGYIDIFTVDTVGEQRLLRTYQAGDVVGELALLDGQPRSARARANGPLTVFMLQRNHFNMFINSRPRVILAVLQFLADRVRYTTDAVTVDPTPQTPAPAVAAVAGDVAPLASDSVVNTQSAVLGIFARISQALDDLESSTGKKT